MSDADYDVTELRQALWDVLRILGEDLDGNATPDACVDLIGYAKRAATDFRAETDPLIDPRDVAAHLRALVKFLFPDDITPNAKRVLLSCADKYKAGMHPPLGVEAAS